MSAQFWKNDSNLVAKDNIWFLNEVVPFLNERNYLGNLLSPHLFAVMEIMYHNMLKAGPLRDQWTETFPELYDFMKTSSDLEYSYDPPITLKVVDYFGTETELPYFPHMDHIREEENLPCYDYYDYDYDYDYSCMTE